MTFTQMLENSSIKDGVLTTDIPEYWSQGRTSYGGITAALCYHGAQAALLDQRVLRSAMINFVGPVAGQVKVETDLLRVGRNAASVRAQLAAETGIGVAANFVFSSERESKLDITGPSLPEAMPDIPTKTAQPNPLSDFVPNFVRQFEWVWSNELGPFVHTGQAYEVAWVRHKDLAARNTMAGLICLADALPPAVAPVMTEFKPISSMTWMIDILTDTLDTDHGWWLLESKADFAGGGHCSQDMTIWNTRGQCIAKARQMVAIFW